MTRPPLLPSSGTESRQNRRGLEQTKQRGPERWIYVDGNSALCPAFQNSFDHAPAPRGAVAFRHDTHGQLEWKGAIDASAAASGTVAFTLPAEYIPDHDDEWPTAVWDGAAYSLGFVFIDSTTGDVSIFWT